MFRLVVTYRVAGTSSCRQQNYNFDSLGAALNRVSVEKAKKEFYRIELFTLVEKWERTNTFVAPSMEFTAS